MEIGCHLPNQGPLATRQAVETFSREAEQRQVASLWVSDHVIFPRTATGSYPGGRFPHPPDKAYLEPVITLTAAAMCTTRARLGASVFVLGHRHPIVMAKMLTTIDALSEGRLIVAAQRRALSGSSMSASAARPGDFHSVFVSPVPYRRHRRRDETCGSVRLTFDEAQPGDERNESSVRRQRHIGHQLTVMIRLRVQCQRRECRAARKHHFWFDRPGARSRQRHRHRALPLRSWPAGAP